MAQPLFSHLDLEVPAGTICGMLGPNGSGKSTLLKIIAGLLFPDQGNCRVLEDEPARRAPAFFADVFFLPEEMFVPALSADQYENRYAPFYPKYAAAVFARLMQEFQLPRDKKLNTFSQGQKKKFLLAFGIATNTRLLIMDEPSNGLDIPGKSQFRKVLVNHFDENRTFIISTHQVHDLEGLVDSVLIISDGRILLNQSLDAVATRIAVSREMAAPDDALYFEEGLEGFEVIRENRDGLESRIDLGLLFGFVTTETKKANALLLANEEVREGTTNEH
jgi:ABC-2 type transport system ATP-binding protein